MDTARLKAFFLKLIKLGILHPGVGMDSATSKLLDDMVLRGNHIVKRIVGDYNSDYQEYRLNGAGLKLFWRNAKTVKPGGGEYRRFECFIAGDQVEDFPTFTLLAKALIASEGFQQRR